MAKLFWDLANHFGVQNAGKILFDIIDAPLQGVQVGNTLSKNYVLPQVAKFKNYVNEQVENVLKSAYDKLQLKGRMGTLPRYEEKMPKVDETHLKDFEEDVEDMLGFTRQEKIEMSRKAWEAEHPDIISLPENPYKTGEFSKENIQIVKEKEPIKNIPKILEKPKETPNVTSYKEWELDRIPTEVDDYGSFNLKKTVPQPKELFNPENEIIKEDEMIKPIQNIGKAQELTEEVDDLGKMALVETQTGFQNLEYITSKSAQLEKEVGNFAQAIKLGGGINKNVSPGMKLLRGISGIPTLTAETFNLGETLLSTGMNYGFGFTFDSLAAPLTVFGAFNAIYTPLSLAWTAYNIYQSYNPMQYAGTTAYSRRKSEKVDKDVQDVYNFPDKYLKDDYDVYEDWKKTGLNDQQIMDKSKKWTRGVRTWKNINPEERKKLISKLPHLPLKDIIIYDSVGLPRKPFEFSYPISQSNYSKSNIIEPPPEEPVLDQYTRSTQLQAKISSLTGEMGLWKQKYKRQRTLHTSDYPYTYNEKERKNHETYPEYSYESYKKTPLIGQITTGTIEGKQPLFNRSFDPNVVHDLCNISFFIFYF